MEHGLKKSRPIEPNEILLAISLRIGILGHQENTKSGLAKFNRVQSFAWLLTQSGLSILGSWVWANYYADYGFRGSKAYSHENWALQGSELGLNFLILFAVLTAQLLKFCLQAPVLFGDSYKVRKNTFYLVAILAIQIFIVYLASPKIQYDLVLNSPFEFTILWAFLATFTFVGLKKMPSRLKNE
jgi:hypothetical protein